MKTLKNLVGLFSLFALCPVWASASLSLSFYLDDKGTAATTKAVAVQFVGMKPSVSGVELRIVAKDGTTCTLLHLECSSAIQLVALAHSGGTPVELSCVVKLDLLDTDFKKDHMRFQDIPVVLPGTELTSQSFELNYSYKGWL